MGTPAVNILAAAAAYSSTSGVIMQNIAGGADNSCAVSRREALYGELEIVVSSDTGSSSER